jgi:hypothetical protein
LNVDRFSMPVWLGRRLFQRDSVDLTRLQHARAQYRHADLADGVDLRADIQRHLGHPTRAHVDEFAGFEDHAVRLIVPRLVQRCNHALYRRIAWVLVNLLDHIRDILSRLDYACKNAD